MGIILYYLADDGRTPIPLTGDAINDDPSLLSGKLSSSVKKHVARDTLSDGTLVSTVFLMVDHSDGTGLPILWETMILGGLNDGYQDRYSSYEDAVKGHARALTIAFLDAKAK